jgi:hypothetical protein
MERLIPLRVKARREVPRAYGELAINLSATYIKFLLDLKKELSPPTKTSAAEPVFEDDIPF